MGNKGSKGIASDGSSVKLDPNKFKLANILDHIATKYILTQNFKDLTNLDSEKYCNELVVITADIMKKFFNDREIKFLQQRTQRGIVIEKMTKGKVIYMKREDLNNLEIMSKLKKKRMCIGIAKFYIKIAHLFSAIVKTINPEYKFKNAEGVTEIVSLLHKDSIPRNAKVSFLKSGLCARRINALRPVRDDQNGYIVKGKNCKMNMKTETPSFSSLPEEPLEWDTQKTTTKHLDEEDGIPELEFLYRDVYDFNTGKYVSMSKKSRKQYENDVKTFYEVFSGGQKMPESIKKFSDIPLKDFHNQGLCTEKKSPWKDEYVGNKSSGLMKKYAEHIAKMIENAQNTEHELVYILNSIFVYWTIKGSNKKTVTIDPNLTEKKLNKIIKQARDIIVQLYIQCEKDFQTGLKIFESIVKKKMLDTAESKIENLSKQSEELLVSKPEVSVHVNDITPLTNENSNIVENTKNIV